MHLNFLQVIFCYLFIMNIVGLAVMGIDKSRAKRHAWRISETALFLVSLLGGSIGTWAGMRLFRHKTKHWRFVIGMPLIGLFHMALAGYLFFRIFG